MTGDEQAATDRAARYESRVVNGETSTHFNGDGRPEHNRCEDYSTEPGVYYHAHDVPRCSEQGVEWVAGRWCCERHAAERKARS